MQKLLIGVLVALAIALIARGFLVEQHTPDQAPRAAANPTQEPEMTDESDAEPSAKIQRTEAEWRELLSDEEFRIARQAGTEPAFTGEYCKTKASGTYTCRCCGTPLFSSDAKFDSGCGWPSFFEPLEGFRITENKDTTFGMVRVEVCCERCDAHLGHVFPDAPQTPTGMRYCINSASIKLVEAEIEDPGSTPK